MSRSRWGLAPACVAFWVAAAALLGAGPPEIKRVHTTAQKATSFFPAGSQFRVLSVPDFERLAADAQAGASLARHATTPRLLRAEHHAKLVGGLLSGETFLYFDVPATAPSIVEIQPWTPALVVDPKSTSPIVNADDGRAFVRLDASTGNPVHVTWSLRARTGSDGMIFSLGLPRVEISSLRLDLPAGIIPEGSTGIRQGPVTADRPGRQLWRFDGAPGLIDLRLRKSSVAGILGNRPRNWIGGRTTIDLENSVADWRGEWTVDLGVGSSRTLFLDIDPGLELIDVQGPAVLNFRSEPLGNRSRLTVELSEDVAASSPITIHALAPLPDEGVWTVPTMEPVEAVWTGGRTSVRVGSARALETCLERAGVRVNPTPEERKERQAGDLWLDFETTGARSVAELTLRRPRDEQLADVVSRLNVGREEMTLNADIRWTVPRGRLLIADVVLPSDWTIERATTDSKDVVISWLVEPVSGGGSRLVVRPSEAIPAGKDLSLRVTATAVPPTLGGWLELPRVRTPGAIAVDERALLFTDATTNVRSVDARGIVWLDPETIERNEGAVLAWRWAKDDARGRVAFDPRALPTTATVREIVSIDPDRLRLSAQVKLELGDGVLRRLRFSFDGPRDASLIWRLKDEPNGPPLPLRRLGSDVSTPSSPTFWEVELPFAKRGSVELSVESESRWSGQGTIPRFDFEPDYPASGRIQINVDRSMRTTLEAEDVRVLDSLAGEPSALGSVATTADPRHRPAHLISYQGNAGRVRLTTENLSPVACEGIIREAVLSSRFLSAGATLHQLDLHILMTGARELGFRLPDGLRLQQARVDGRPAVPFSEGDWQKIPLAPSNSTRSGCVVHLEFSQAGRTLPSTAARPLLPEFSLPIVSMVWQIDSVGKHSVSSTGLLVPMKFAGYEGLTSARAAERLGPSWSSLRWNSAGTSDDEAREELRKHIRALSGIDLTFGELFTKLDAGRWPLVLDRIALSTRGITPTTLFPASAARVGAMGDPLGEFGLLTVPVGNAWLITTERDRPSAAGWPMAAGEREKSWKRAVNEVLTRGCDVGDRYRTVARWSLSVENLADSAVAEAEWGDREFSSSWFATFGSSLEKARVSIDPSSIPHGLAWGVGVVLLGLGIGCGTWNPRVRLAVLALIVPAVLFGVPHNLNHADALVTGTLWGTLACLTWWNGRRRRTFRAVAPASTRSTSVLNKRVGAGLGVAILAGSLSWILTSPTARGAADDESPILAVFAEEPGAPKTETRVVLLLADDTRLRSLADRGKSTQSQATAILASSVEHRIRPAGKSLSEVESRYTLLGERPTAGIWSFPIGSARDVRATLNGREVPILIQPGGQVGQVAVPAGPAAELTVRRVLAREPRDENESLNLLVAPVAAAAVLLEPAAGDGVPTFPSSRGEVETQADGTCVADLGPTNRLEILWSRTAPGERPRPRGSADAVLLWDAEPAGDRVRVRLSLNNLRDPSQFRLGLDPGWVVLSTSIPGLIDSSLRGSRERPEWVARMDPPLPEGATIRFELWRPRESSVSRGGADNDSLRTLPRIEPLDVAAFIGRLGFRRPDGWRGRLGAAAGSDPLADDEFLNAWGTLPDNRATLAGAIRYALTPKFPVDVAPIPVRVLLTPEIGLQLQPGRILVSASFAVETRNGIAREIDLQPPSGMIVTRVEAAGLSDWSVPSPDQLVVRFDRAPASQFTLKVNGFLPLTADRAGSRPAENEIPVPAFRSTRSELLAGRLTIQAPQTTVIRVSSPATARAGRESDAVQVSKGSLVAPIDANSPQGTLSWTDETSRVQVLVRGVMTMNLNSVDWSTSLRYRGSDGPIDRVAFQLPTSWSENATVTIAGNDFRREQKVDGDHTIWTLVLARPNWGDLTIRVNASRPLPADRIMAFPDLLPLGRGRVDTYLALANSTAFPLSAEGSSSVREVDSSRFGPLNGLADDFKPQRAYQVLRDGWTLRARLGLLNAANDPLRNPVTVGSADFRCVIDDAGNLLGEARFVLESESSAFLPLVLPAKAEVLAALVERQPIRPLVGKGGLLLIPLGEGHPRQVSVVWKDRSHAKGEVILPSLRQENVPTLVRVDLPPGRMPVPTDSRLQRISPAGRQERLLEWKNLEITTALIPTFNRGEPREQAELLAALVDFEVQARFAEHAAEHSAIGPAASEAAGRRAMERIKATRASLRDSLHLAGLESFGQSARARVGIETSDPLPDVPRLVERAVLLGIPELGIPWDFARSGTEGTAPLRFLHQPLTSPAPSFSSLDPETLAVSCEIFGFLCVCLLLPSFLEGTGRIRRAIGGLAILSLSIPLGVLATLSLVALAIVRRTIKATV